MTLADSLRHLGRASPDDRSDGELVTGFVRARDESAFAELLRRHGPSVYGVCRRILGPGPDADDAFQAVFLVLARKADSVRPPGMVGGWLHGVAVRTANKARVMAARRVKHERAATARERVTDDHDTLAVIDTELAALPAVYRAAFVACEVNGRTRREAADLGWPEGTVAARLAKARELLAARLRKRGVTLSVGAFAAVAVPPAVAADAFAAVRELLAVGTADAVLPTAQRLSDEVVKAMTAFKLKLAAACALVMSLALGGAALLAGGSGQPPAREPVKAPVPKDVAMEWKEATPITFTDGGRVTGVAYSPSGKSLAVARDTGKLDFYDPVTRKHLVAMNVAGEAGDEKATVTAVAFAPTPHPKNGDIFAVTHKHGVKFGTVGLGVFTDDAAKVEGIPPNIAEKDFDPHQVMWLPNGGVIATNGARMWERVAVKGGWESSDWNQPGTRGQPILLAALPGQSQFYLNSGHTEKERTEVQIAARPPLSSPQARLPGHRSRPLAAAVSKDGTRIVTADGGSTLIVWEGKKLEFKEKSRYTVGSGGPGFAAFALAPDGKTVAYVRTYGVSWLGALPNRSSEIFELFVFDITDPPAKPTPIWVNDTRSMPGKRSGPVSLAFGPDGNTLLAAFADPFTDDKQLYGDIPKSVGVKVWELVPRK